MLEVRNLVKKYYINKKSKSKYVVALNNVSIKFPDKGLVFLLGKSGSGKSTLLNSIGGLDSFDSGEVIIKGKSSKNFTQTDFDSYRNTFIGFIFQEYNVLEEFSVAKNLSLAIELQGKDANKQLVDKLLNMVDLQDFAKRKPNQLSGGQKQRVAIARALIKDPEIIMADEPTGALDSATGKQVMDTLKKLSRDKLVIIVSHDRDFAEQYGDRIIEMKDGNIISDVTKKAVMPAKTQTGLDYVDGLIHIKQGKRFTKDEVKELVGLVLQSSANNDVLVSLNNVANTEIKKANNITDKGYKQVFDKTLSSDIKTRNYGSGDCNLIKSRLRFKDSFKMGASALKNKVWKLIFTIFLSFIAFGMFGLVDTFSCYNRAEAMANTVVDSNIDYIPVAKMSKAEFSDDYELIKSADLQALKQKFPNIDFKSFVGTGINFGSGSYINSKDFEIEDLKKISSYSDFFNNLKYSAFTTLTAEDMETFGINLYGSLPVADNEVCITQKHFESLVKANPEKHLTKDLILNTYNKLRLDYENKYKIVGIIDDQRDLSKYKTLLTKNSGDYKIRQQYEVDVYFSFTNALICNKNTYNKVYKDNFSCRFPIVYEDKLIIKEEINDAISLSKAKEDSLPLGYIKKSNRSGNTIGYLMDNEVVLSQHIIDMMEISDVSSKIESGLNIKYDDKNFVVVGVMPFNYQQSMIFSDSCIISLQNELKDGSDFIYAKLPKSDQSKYDFVLFCETLNNNISYNMQVPATILFNEYGYMIEGLTEILFYVGIGFAVFSALLLMNFISTSISYKKREIGILRALGARSKDVFGIFFIESILIALINFVLAIIATFVVIFIINMSISNLAGMNLTMFSVGIRQILLLLGVSCLVALIASFLPVYKFAKKKPIDAINNR